MEETKSKINHQETQTTEPDFINLYEFVEHPSLYVRDPPKDIHHVVNKEYVDSEIRNIKFEKDVSKFHDPKIYLPKNPLIGERFISSGTGNNWYINNIYEYTGECDNLWKETCPNKGSIIWVQYENETTFIFNGIMWEKFGKTINHNDLKDRGNYTHHKIDDHINNQNLHLRENQISHQNIRDIGIFSHKNIDEHIHNSTNAHFGNNLKKTEIPTFRAVRVSETSMASHVATKEYVDSKIQGLNWLRPTKALHDPSAGLPTNNLIGERYISLSTSHDWKKNYIYEFDGNEWKEIIPVKETAVLIEEGDICKGDTLVFTGLEWIKFCSIYNHDNLHNAGIHSHQEIDEHLFNSTDAHFGQSLAKESSPNFENMSINSVFKTKENKSVFSLVRDRMQIGDYVLPQQIQEMNNFSIVGNNDRLSVSYIYADVSSNESININHLRARGDIYHPEGLLNEMPIGTFTYSGHDGEAYKVTSLIQCETTEDYSPNNHGSAINFCTTENGRNLPNINLRLDHDGSLKCYCTNDSFSTLDGALMVDGGASIRKNISIGGSVKTQNICFDNSEVISMIQNDTPERFDNKITHICGGGNSVNKRGSIISVSGIDSDLDGKIKFDAGFPNGSIDFYTRNDLQMSISKNGQCQILNDANTTSLSTGSLIVSGGVAVGRDLYVGGNKIYLNGTSPNVICPDSGEFHDRSKISICGGGNNDTNRGAFIDVIGNNNLKDSGCVNFHTGTSCHGQFNFITENSGMSIQHDGNIHIYSTADATNLSTGSLVVEGGVSVRKTLCVSNIKCIEQMKIPTLYVEPKNPEIGTIYFHIVSQVIKIFTPNGWKTIKIE